MLVEFAIPGPGAGRDQHDVSVKVERRLIDIGRSQAEIYLEQQAATAITQAATWYGKWVSVRAEMEAVKLHERALLASPNKGKPQPEGHMDINEMIVQLHARGMSIMECIKTIRHEFTLSLGEAKSKVCDHPAWRDVVEAAQPLHDTLEELLKPDSSLG